MGGVIYIMDAESISMVNVLEEILRSKPSGSSGDTIHALIARDGTLLAVWAEPPVSFTLATPQEVFIQRLTENFPVFLTAPYSQIAGFAFEFAEVKISQSLHATSEVAKTGPWHRVMLEAGPGGNMFVMSPAKPAGVKKYVQHLCKIACALLAAMVLPHLLAFSHWAPPAPPPPAREPITVYIKGFVHKPGVYRLAGNALIMDAVQAAGGFAPGAEPNQLNLAQPTSDYQEIVVPGSLPKLL